MNEAQRGEGATRNLVNWSLFLVSITALLPRLLDALRRPIDYNGYWHVFIARNLPREWLNLQHPPLFLVPLKLADSVSQSVLSYRSISLLAGVGSIYLVGRVLRKLDTLPAVGVLGALTAASAFNAITLSNEVESYSLAVLFLLGSFFFYLDLAVPSTPPRRSRIAFASLSCLALASHYFTGLYLIACGLAPAVAAALQSPYRRDLLAALPRRWKADVLTFLPPAIVGFLLYEYQAKPWVTRLSSLPSFYFQPGTEGWNNFLVRNLREVFNLFSPISLPRARYALPVLALYLLAVLWGGTRTPKGASRLMPALFLALLLVVGAVLGVLGKYPFGGMMRHQFLFFLFGLLSGFVAFDALLRAVRSPSARAALIATCLLAIALNFAAQLRTIANPPYPFRPKVEAYEKAFRDTRKVNVDQFNLVGLFSVYYDWTWRSLGRDARDPWVERFELTKGEQRLLLVAFRNWWIFDFRNPWLYKQMRAVWEGEGDACQLVFCVSGTIFSERSARTKVSDRDRAELSARLTRLAAEEGLQVRKLSLSDFLDVAGSFCRSRSTESIE